MSRQKRTRYKGYGPVKFGPALVFAIILFFNATSLKAQGRIVEEKAVDIIIQAAFFLSLQVGTEGAVVDTISFDVNNIPGSGEIQGSSSGTYPVPVAASAFWFSGELILTVDSLGPLQDGTGTNTIPFSEIRWDGGGALTGNRFNGTASQRIHTTTSSSFQGTMRFFYDNDLYVPPGTYSGTVTYTLSSP